ncbi:hypothetical protein CDV52_09065 [Haematobacter missouriensis]|uniref:TIGR03016 family PEP-CTERM system-associated outer membrane protein n=1 Tax=Haematobacter missouriensis TaxID=366616 RepID=A0A212ARA4_9RHOB|nr:hypothetical protein [Haematobacter missouriensis]OWJ84032.1 hypothetical protein CDV52_09065 [Haematobacter missouriensis]
MTPLRPARLASINRGAEQPRVAGGIHRLPLTLLLLAGTALVSAETAHAQAARGGDLPNPLLTFSFSSSLHVSDNYDLSQDPAGTTTYVDNTLGLSYLSETDVQKLSLAASGVLRLADYPSDATNSGYQTDFDNQTLRFGYTLTGADSELTSSAYYNRSDIAFFDPFRLVQENIDLEAQDLTSSDGYREMIRADVGFQTGMSGPLSFHAELSAYKRNFLETTDPTFEDNEAYTATTGFGFLITPTTRLTLDGLYRDYSADDAEQTDRRTRSLSAGASHEVGTGLTLNGSIGYQEIETEETDLLGYRGTKHSTGVIGSLGAMQELTNGTVGINFNQSRNTTGSRSTLQVSRAMELPSGSLALSLGASRGETGKTSAIGSISYDHALESGTLSARVSQSVKTNSDDNEVETRDIRLRLTHELSPVSEVALSVSYADLNNLENSGGDRTRSQFRASYSHDLTQDWELSGGYEYTQLERPSGTAKENAVFLTIQRQFHFRP